MKEARVLQDQSSKFIVGRAVSIRVLSVGVVRGVVFMGLLKQHNEWFKPLDWDAEVRKVVVRTLP